uniref:Putative tail protein n=1 Tax=viral metagenome TaxID=1070528 RepID=A0A6M3KY68_9ZZZZ
MPLITQRTQLAVETEGSEGTAETLVVGDMRHCLNPVWSPDTPMDDRMLVDESLSPHALVPGLRSAKMEFDMELKGSGTAGTAPAIGEVLLGCGFKETIVGGTSVTYTPLSTGDISLTLALYMDGLIKKMWGARGDVNFSLNVGKPGMAHFVFTGADYSVTDGAMLSPTYETTNPPVFLSSSFSVQSYSALVGVVEIAMNNAITLRQDANLESGHYSAVRTKRLPTMTIDPEAVLVATHDFYGRLRAGTEAALSITLGATPGNICTITAPKVQYKGISSDDKDGYRNFGIECQLNRSSGDDELSIAFT